jgi:hypothetical protein
VLDARRDDLESASRVAVVQPELVSSSTQLTQIASAHCTISASARSRQRRFGIAVRRP